ncbi:MAG: helix-turn-helix domain-containing protein [Dehalococcoidales bacterium]|nr:helix-turn-helix domain-containing protein [Dehalococcoidales bacterium]
MARKPIVDRDIVLRMLQEGSSTQQVAERFGVSRQAVDLHRKDFINQGLLKNERAARKLRSSSSPSATAPADIPSKSTASSVPASIDDLIELMITAFTALKRVPELETQLDQYKDAYKRTLKEVERLSKETEKRHDQELRWNLSQQVEPGTWPIEE